MKPVEFAISLLRQHALEIKMTLLARDSEPAGSTFTATFNMSECRHESLLGPYCLLELEWQEATRLQECLVEGKSLLEKANEWAEKFSIAGFEVMTSMKIHALESLGPWAEQSESVGWVIFEGESFSFENEYRVKVKTDEKHSPGSIEKCVLEGLIFMQ